jgi:hypothetical protein
MFMFQIRLPHSSRIHNFCKILILNVEQDVTYSYDISTKQFPMPTQRVNPV